MPVCDEKSDMNKILTLKQVLRPFYIPLRPIYVRLFAVLAYFNLHIRASSENIRDHMLKGYVDQGSLPVPPPLLRFRVHGALDLHSFLSVGSSCANDIKRLLLNTVGEDLPAFSHVLDFGCGCGRVLRHFHNLSTSCRFYGTDIDEQAIDWCSRHLEFARFKVNSALPTTSFEDATFDLVYAISVFTHLDEEYQIAWLRELKRISKPGGLLLLTVHGKSFLPNESHNSETDLDETGFLYLVHQTGKLKLDGLPDFYQTAYHSETYIRREWSKFSQSFAMLSMALVVDKMW
jgi:SAM-dependent methyltransferase